jgi:hypothetical protein
MWGGLRLRRCTGRSARESRWAVTKLPANQEFQLVWRTVNVSWRVADAQYHGREYEPVAYEIAKVRSERTALL